MRLGVGEFIHVVGDGHIYLNQVDAVKEQLSRTPHNLPALWINPVITDIDEFTLNDFKLLDYVHDKPILAPMAV